MSIEGEAVGSDFARLVGAGGERARQDVVLVGGDDSRSIGRPMRCAT